MAKKRPTQTRSRNPVKGIPVEETNLTPEERALLPDPTIVTEDDADAITIFRRRLENPKLIPFDKILAQYGLERQRTMGRRRD